MGRLLGKEDFIDTFGLNLTRPVPAVPKRGPTENDYTPDELKILREFDELTRGSTLNDDSNFKKRLRELAEKRLRKAALKDDE